MTRRVEQGFSTLAMCAVLLGVLALGAAWATRQLTTAQRVAANDFRAALAFEAAESGLAWAVAMLNGGAIDDACRPASAPGSSASPGAPSASDFRNRFLEISMNGHYRAPFDAAPAGLPGCSNAEPLRWICRCATKSGGAMAGAGDPATPGAGARPQFSVRFADAGWPGQVKLIARGCSDQRADCDDLSAGPVAVAESAQHLALLSALRSPPATARVEGPGSFVRVFGIPPARYRSQPALVRLRCAGDCAEPLAQALARGRRLIWFDGDARLSRWPDAALNGEPLVLIVDGQLDLSAPGHTQGLLYARGGVNWHPPAGLAASLRGAVVTDGVIGHGRSVQVIHDGAVLTRIQRQMGSFLPVPGGWTPTR
jgi:hypothetical protein